MKNIVYRIVSSSTGKYYIGSSVNLKKRIAGHFRSLRKGEHHNINLQKVYNKYGEADLRVEELRRTSSVQKLRKLEAAYLKANISSKKCLNIGMASEGGDNLSMNPNKEDIKRRITDTTRRRMDALSPKQKQEKFGRKGVQNGMYGRTHTKEAREIMSQANIGHSRNKGIKKSEQGRLNIKKAAQARANSDDYVNSFQGKRHTGSTKETLRQKAKERYASGFRPKNSRKVRVEGITYESVSQASRESGVGSPAIIYRIKSPNFANYEYVD